MGITLPVNREKSVLIGGSVTMSEAVKMLRRDFQQVSIAEQILFERGYWCGIRAQLDPLSSEYSWMSKEIEIATRETFERLTVTPGEMVAL